MSIPIEDLWAGKVDLSDVVDSDQPPLPPVTPGEILLEEFMRPLGLSVRKLSAAIGVPPNRISQILRGERSISASTALRLGRYFNMTPEFWINMQAHYDLKRAREEEGERVLREVQPRAQAA